VTLVLDASAALELVMARPERLSVAALLQHYDWMIAPSLFVYEVANALWNYRRQATCIWKLCAWPAKSIPRPTTRPT